MKLNKLKYLSFAVALGLTFVACEDDDPITAGAGDPDTKNIVNLDATLTTAQSATGEGNTLAFSVTLPQTFASDATVTTRVELDNGETTLGTATVAAGATSGTGSIVLPGDDGVITGATIAPVDNSATLKVVGFLLEEEEPGTLYVVNSNTVDLALYPDTLAPDGGLNILLDWDNPAANDLDLQVIDRAFTAIFENSDSGDRFESDLFQNTGRADGIYDIYVIPFTAVPAEGINFALLLTQPDGTLAVLNGSIPSTATTGARVAVGTFEKVTDPVTGVVSYENIELL